MLMCLALERGACWESSHNCMRHRASCLLCWWVGWVSLLLLLVRREEFGRNGPILPLAQISFPPQPPELALWGGRPYQAWASWGLPKPLPEKWQIGMTGLLLWHRIVQGGGTCHVTPMWPWLPAPTYWCLWQSVDSLSLFTTTRGTKKVEAIIPGGDANKGAYRGLF